MSRLGGKEGLERRWAGHDALTKIESVGSHKSLGLSFLRNFDPRTFLFGMFTFSSPGSGGCKPIDVLSNQSFVEQPRSIYTAAKSRA